jgi:serine/threonine protein kinase
MRLALFDCIARAVVKNGLKCLLSWLPFGGVLYEIARDALEDWKLRRTEQQRCLDLEALANLTRSEARAQAEQAAAEVATAAVEREALAGYLAQLPGVVRRSLSRPQDMTGRTVPAGLPLDRAEDIVPFLPPRPPRFRPGQRIDGCGIWELEDLLGVGGFGEVWKARSTATDGAEARALKFCLDPAAMASLVREKELLERMAGTQHNPGLVPLRGHCLQADPPFLVYDYVPGGDLTRLIRCWHEPEPPSPRLIPEAVRLVRTLATYLQGAHEMLDPVVHRDLKPSNILLQPTHPGKVALRIADFGIGGVAARHALEKAQTTSSREALTTSLKGAHTPLYASPQQMHGGRPDPRDDVFALGVIGYQVLTGDTTSGPPPDWDDELADRKVPRSVIAGLGRCLATDARQRLPHARAVVESLGSPEGF